MSRYERGQYFEALCQLRDGYANRSDDDRRPALSVDDAILYAEAVMAAIEVEDQLTVVEASALTAETSASDPRD